MKKVITILAMLLVACSLFAANSETYNKVLQSMETGKKSDLPFVAQNSEILRDVNEYVAYQVYKENRMKYFFPTVLNSSIGFGVGSFVQGVQ